MSGLAFAAFPDEFLALFAFQFFLIGISDAGLQANFRLGIVVFLGATFADALFLCCWFLLGYGRSLNILVASRLASDYMLLHTGLSGFGGSFVRLDAIADVAGLSIAFHLHVFGILLTSFSLRFCSDRLHAGWCAGLFQSLG